MNSLESYPEVTAIVPAHNAGRYIAETLESILSQNVVPQEILVVDDGSTDTTAEIVRAYDDVHYEGREHSGLSATLNYGIRAAQHDILAFCDADDIWPEDKQARQFARLARFPSAEIVLGHIQRVWPDENRRAEPELIYSIGCCLVRRSVFDKIGFFDETMDFYEDWEWFLRVKEGGIRINIHKDVVTYYRQHAASMSASEAQRQRNIAIMLKRARDRRRQ